MQAQLKKVKVIMAKTKATYAQIAARSGQISKNPRNGE